MKKIYNKKTFWIGIVFAVISLVYIALIVNKIGDVDSSLIIKHSLYSLVSMILSFFFIRQSSKLQEKDQREEEINQKSYKASMRIIQVISWLAMIISIVTWYISKVDGIIGMILAFGIMFNISLFAEPIAYIYYDRKYIEEEK